MGLKLGMVLSGFTVTSARELPELNARIYEMEHDKSGARLVWLDRDDENKTFGIAFRTVPSDDTGVFHILEHSVLCGSDRYPVKEPFVELMKSSLQTFLNAMTFPDKTFYPVSSRNDKDFLNLMRVYMDAVLHPLIYRRPEIFEQEGWRVELPEEGEPSYQGVVLNEMKGAFADPDTLMNNELGRQLFPETCYRYVSGGDPAHILDLTYEQFLDSHRRFYHPSNSYLFLDGRVDLDGVLSVLDGEYLNAYDREEQHTEIPIQPPVKSGPVRVCYESAPGEPAQGKARLAWGSVLGDFSCRREALAVRVLADVLCGGNDAPLKRRILSTGLAQDVRIQVMDGIRQPYAILQAVNLDEDRSGEVRDAVREELARLVREGLDHEQIRATLANLEFQLRERDYGQMPQGLGLGMTVLESWLYGGDPAAGLEVAELFRELDRGVDEGYFERLLERTFLDAPHSCQVLLAPDPAAGQARWEQEAARLREERSRWDRETEAALRERQENRLTWQSRPDPAEALATLPKLALSDLPAEPENVPTEAGKLAGVPLLSHSLPTGGVDYVNLYFDVSDLSGERLSCLSFLCTLLGELDTDGLSAAELKKRTRLDLGGLHFGVEAYSRENRPETCRTLLCVSFSTLEEKLARGTALAAEMLTRTKFDDPKKLLELLRQTITWMETGVASNGAGFAMTRVSAGLSAEGAVREYAGGVAYIQWLKELERHFEDRAAGLQAELSGLLALAGTAGRLTVSVTGQDGNAASVLKEELLSRLPAGPQEKPACAAAPWGRKREGVVIPADVSFAVMGGSLLPYGGGYDGRAPALGRVMTLAYLWGAVRVQGGAYGTGFGVGETGNASFYSYRDPNAARSLGCYRQAADVLRQLSGRVNDLTDFLIGAVAASEPYQLPKRQGKTADGWYWKSLTHADRCRQRAELLSTTAADLAAFAAPLERMTEQSSICVVGSRRQIEDCGGELDDVIVL